MESLYDKYMSYQGPVKKMITLLHSTGILHDKKVSWQEYLICN